ncbi:MAG: nucleotidyltransferase domain-containing protein [Candidatus Omnitrophica bacterium]|nr:nucleotidyltransferase domain-containing protein [Candidatus Omnitrophota bacterium]
MKKNILFVTNAQKVLLFLVDHPIRNFLESEIQKATKISKSGVNYALRALVAADFLFRTKRGKVFFYTLNHKNLVVKELKVIETITQIDGLLKKLEPLVSKIILFGSSSRGENTPDSDIDLLVISRNKEFVSKQIEKFKSKRKIQSVICTNLSFIEKKKTAPVFYEQVNKGIVLSQGENSDF